VAQQPPAVKPPETPQDCSAVNGYEWDTKTAYAICMAESRGNHLANNAGTNRDNSTDYGLMQINSIHADMVGGDLEKLYDPRTNLDIAYRLYKAKGFQPWSVYNNGKYLAFL
jgi:soluble lytic murein transglycosylase-like protein